MNPTHNFARAFVCTFAVVLPLSLCPGDACGQYRTSDGLGNNVANPTWGSTGSQLLRIAPAAYPGDGSGSSMDYDTRPNPRAVSNLIFDQISNLPNKRGMTNGVWQWGQFIDHDIDLTGSNPANGATVIMAPPDDSHGMTMIPFNRSNFDSATGISAANPRQQINQITSWLDGSVVYGSDADRAGKLRAGVGGMLKMSGNGSLLPLSDQDADLASLFMDDGGLGAPQLFVAGDVRTNEQVGLTAIQTLFAREHQRLTGVLAAANTSWDDDELYDRARKMVGAEIQAITYNEFLPSMLGDHAPSATDYNYDQDLNGSIATEFSTALFRVGHTMLSPTLPLAGSGGVNLGSLSLRESFFNPAIILDEPEIIDHVLMGLAKSQSQEIDSKMVDDVRSFLFTPDGGVGLDLAALNIQRGRDHGLPDYNTMRQAYGLDPVNSFDEITSNAELIAALESLYTSVDNVDAWVGALAEDHMPGSGAGELVTAGMVDQFTRLRDGDRFFYIGDAQVSDLEIITGIELDTLNFMDIMTWNTALEDMPDSFFMSVPVPEPATFVLLAVAATTICGTIRRRC